MPKDLITVIVPAGVQCNTCARWNTKTGCPKSSLNTDGLAAFGACPHYKPKRNPQN